MENSTARQAKPAGAARGAARGKGTAADQERRLYRSEMLLGVSHRLAAIDSLDEILEILVEMTSMEVGAERGSLFLNDSQTGELYSIVAQGNFKRRIRVLNTSGIAGHVFQAGKGIIVHDVYRDKRFNLEVDKQTGYVTRDMICTPIRTVRGEIIGVAQVLNKRQGRFTRDDLELLEAITMQAAIALQGAQFIEKMRRSRAQELEFLDVVADITSEIELGTLLRKVMGEATRMLQADRSTLFLNDERSNELWSLVGEGIGATQIRFPNHLSIAGAVFTSGVSVNIPHAYADLRFNPAFDKKTGYFTRSILCTPVVNKQGKTIGVTQVLNRRGGPFSDEDESRLKAFTAQVSIALENAKLFNDVENMKNYNESMLQSMSNGVVTLDEDGRIVTCNAAGQRIMKVESAEVIGRDVADFFAGRNSWIVEKAQRVEQTQRPELTMDAELEFGGKRVSANISVLPLISGEGKKLGTMIMFEDISGEKRMKSTMSRYMDPGLADQLLAGGEDILGGKSTTATVLFSDIRGFTTLTEELGAHGTVSLLNEYFTLMVDCIQAEGGMLDKFIGDAIMAAFGIPVAHDDNEDRAVRCAIAMINALRNWNAGRAADRKKPVEIGVGLNTDTVVCGNIGSPKRMDYTVIGDGVNLASRLESACKQYSTRILISENTYHRLRGTYRIRDIDDVVVKGKTQPVRIYEVLDYHTDETFPNVMEVTGHFRDGRNAYRSGSWHLAIKSFREALRLHPQDRLSQLYLDRCEHLKANPPEGTWAGVWTMTSK
ncbi:MAG: GAF domain-containing protein [Deltaproteobacteria bacterium]|nr:GAF domain-containing protein [Deltaproteobacteria bacterium]